MCKPLYCTWLSIKERAWFKIAGGCYLKTVKDHFLSSCYKIAPSLCRRISRIICSFAELQSCSGLYFVNYLSFAQTNMMGSISKVPFQELTARHRHLVAKRLFTITEAKKSNLVISVDLTDSKSLFAYADSS